MVNLTSVLVLSLTHIHVIVYRIEVLPMREAKKAVEGVWNGKARYRYVLTQDIES